MMLETANNHIEALNLINRVLLLLKHLINPPLMESNIGDKPHIFKLHGINLDGSPMNVTFFTFVWLILDRIDSLRNLHPFNHFIYFINSPDLYFIFNASYELFRDMWRKQLYCNEFNFLSAYTIDYQNNIIRYDPGSDMYLQSTIEALDNLLRKASKDMSDDIANGIIRDDIDIYESTIDNITNYLDLKDSRFYDKPANIDNVLDISQFRGRNDNEDS